MATTDQKILAVVADVETSSHVLEAAVEQVQQEAASLVVLHVMPYHVYYDRQRSYTTNRDFKSEGYTFTHDQAMESAENVAERVAQATIDNREIPYTAVGRVGDVVPTVIAVAARHGCDTILLPETEPWWRHVLGRADRRLTKRFEGTVVRVPRPVPQNLKTTRRLPKL
ncbi:MAG: universal stress protein [Halobacteriales archaeon]